MSLWVCRYGKQPDASSSEGDGTNGAAQDGAAPFLGNIQKPDGKEALAFIRAHSFDGDEDLLPGLCQFTERWLVQVWHTAQPQPSNLQGSGI